MTEPGTPLRVQHVMTRRSLLWRLFLSGMLGVVTTIAVAWILILQFGWSDPRLGFSYLCPRGSTVSSVAISQAWQPGAIVRVVKAASSDDQEFINAWAGRALPVTSRPLEVLSREQVDASWGLARQALTLERVNFAGTESAHGWPFLALYWWRDDAGSTGSGGTILRVHGDDPWSDDVRILPTLPIGRGFALNSVLFGSTWSVLLIVPAFIRGATRRRRGRCPACGFDLQRQLASGCTECGWNRRADNH